MRGSKGSLGVDPGRDSLLLSVDCTPGEATAASGNRAALAGALWCVPPKLAFEACDICKVREFVFTRAPGRANRERDLLGVSLSALRDRRGVRCGPCKGIREGLGLSAMWNYWL